MGEVHSRSSRESQPRLTIIVAGRRSLLCRLRHPWRPAARFGVVECPRCKAKAVRS